MTFIFDGGAVGSNHGRAVILETGDETQTGSLLALDGWSGFEELKSIFTTVEFQDTTSHQFQHMMGRNIYLNVFGDRIGALRLGGLAFEDNCREIPGHGISKVAEFFRRHKLSMLAEPLRITLDPDLVMEGYLHAIRGATIGEVDLQAYQFSLEIATVPKLPIQPPPGQQLPASTFPDQPVA